MAHVAQRSGISLPHLSNLEHGRRAPTHEHVLALAKALRIPAAERQRWLVLAGLAHIPPGLREAVTEALGS